MKITSSSSFQISNSHSISSALSPTHISRADRRSLSLVQRDRERGEREMAAALSFVRSVVLFAVCMFFASGAVEARVRHYKFNVVMANYTRLCSTKQIVTVNGQFPGPTLYAREGDTLLIKVVNHVKYNLSIHWHGIRQIRTGWADGPAYITQCPIQPSQTYTYNFTITNQRGTLFWHAHILWLRATVHGAIVILPPLGVPYPFPKPHKEVVTVLAEWWKSDTEVIINSALKSGVAPNVSDAHFINGHPGPLHATSLSCLANNGNVSASTTGLNIRVKKGKTYMLRLINAALNEELFVKIAGHNFTVVEVDATYVKPFITDTILIAPGQTTNILVKAKNLIKLKSNRKYVLTASPFSDAPIAVDNVTATATLDYTPLLTSTPTKPTPTTTILTKPPPQNSTTIANTFLNSLHSLNSKLYPTNLPLTITHHLLFTVGLGINPCPTCLATNGSRIVASINNVTFIMPKTALLQAEYFNISGVFTDDFPSKPPKAYNYSGSGPSNLATEQGTKVYRLPYNATVELVLQDTGIVAPESHPIHLHGFNFFVVGRGIGNYNGKTDRNKFNLVDPVERNTVGVPAGGWTAIRFRADNPGVWFMHCHLEVHTTWGLKMAFVVDNGNGPHHSVIPPPHDLPKCH